MHWRWLFGSFGDKDAGLSPDEYKKATELAHEKYISKSQVWGWSLGVAIVWMALFPSTKFIGDWLAGLGTPAPYLVHMLLVILAGWVFVSWMYGLLYLKPVRRAMRDLGHRVCLDCGYRLEVHAAGERCPECGAKVRG